MNNLLKKYSFITSRKISQLIHKIAKRAQYYTSKSDPFLIDPVETHKLSFPAHWKEYGRSPLIVEIGMGHGELLKYLAEKYPERSIVGFEITKTYTRKSAKKAKAFSNAKALVGDGYKNTLDLFPSNSIEKIYILFPDPWHKKKHHKRRPITRQWLIDVRKRLVSGGEIFFASDWDEYYAFVKEQFELANEEKIIYKIETGKYDPTEQGLVVTHYYKKWNEMGRTFDYIKAVVI